MHATETGRRTHPARAGIRAALAVAVGLVATTGVSTGSATAADNGRHRYRSGR